MPAVRSDTVVDLRYRCIAIDPPWPERGGGRIKRGADRHYKVLPVARIPETILRAPCWQPADDSHLWLWVTNNYVPAGHDVMRALGYRHVTMLTWNKDRIGLGQYLRGKSEHCLFGVRGRLPALNRTEPSSFDAPRTGHSVKPQRAYDIMERVSPGPRLEMFARAEREGWTVWGDEV